jgi:Tol biopolymer transport system component
MKYRNKMIATLTIATLAIAGTASAMPTGFGEWNDAIRVEDIPGTDPSFNGDGLDGCPFVSRDDKTFYMASNRDGGVGGIDIWVSTRAKAGDPWGAPVNVGEPVNSTSNDFCPTISRDGHTFFFVSNRPDGCGGDDIYTARRHNARGFQHVTNIGCEANSAGNEASPSPLPQSGAGPVLYFSSTGHGGLGGPDLFMSERTGGVYGAPVAVPGVNSASIDEQPNIRRDGLEIFFFSNRDGGEGGNDIWSASRASTADPFDTPVNLGPAVNSGASETRPSLSWDGTTLYFGSNRSGGDGDSDHYVSTRLVGG